MLFKVIDILLERSFGKELDYDCLDRLELDVRRQIQRRRVAPDIITSLMPALPIVQLRYASLGLAMVTVLVATQISFSFAPKSDTLGLEVFSPNVSFLVTSTFEYSDSARL